MSNKIKQILDRVDAAASGQFNTQNWHSHEDNHSAPDGMDYWEWIEQAGLLAILEHDSLTARVAELEGELIAATELRESLRETIKFCAIEISNQDSKIEALEAK
jgi:hypothetical protein